MIQTLSAEKDRKISTAKISSNHKILDGQGFFWNSHLPLLPPTTQWDHPSQSLLHHLQLINSQGLVHQDPLQLRTCPRYLNMIILLILFSCIQYPRITPPSSLSSSSHTILGKTASWRNIQTSHLLRNPIAYHQIMGKWAQVIPKGRERMIRFYTQ